MENANSKTISGKTEMGIELLVKIDFFASLTQIKFFLKIFQRIKAEIESPSVTKKNFIKCPLKKSAYCSVKPIFLNFDF